MPQINPFIHRCRLARVRMRTPARQAAAPTIKDLLALIAGAAVHHKDLNRNSLLKNGGKGLLQKAPLIVGWHRDGY